MDNVEIYFDSNLHKYTDNFLNTYSSMTTIIDKYVDKFSEKEWDIAKACERIGKNPRHPKYLKYKGMNVISILKSWKREGDKGRDIGNTKHDYLETSVKDSTGFNKLFEHKSGRLFTIKDLVSSKSLLGTLNLEYFIKTGVKDRYPEIFTIIEAFVKDDWEIYSEIATYDYSLLISGLIDILFIKGDKFVILDWKTNKTKLMFESGYYDKDNFGNITDFIYKEEFFKNPLDKLPSSTGNKYTLQLSGYANLTERFGLTNIGLILCHIRHHKYTKDNDKVKKNIDLLDKEVIDLYNIKYLKDETTTMFNHFVKNKNIDKPQLQIF